MLCSRVCEHLRRSEGLFVQATFPFTQMNLSQQLFLRQEVAWSEMRQHILKILGQALVQNIVKRKRKTKRERSCLIKSWREAYLNDGPLKQADYKGIVLILS